MRTSKARNERKSKALRNEIRELYVYYGHSPQKIAQIINEKHPDDPVSKAGVFYHLEKIKGELEHQIMPDAVDRYASEFMRLSMRMEGELDELDTLASALDENQPKDRELLLKIKTQKHNVLMDKMKLLQDAELPIVIQKIKKERQSAVKLLPEAPTETVIPNLEELHERTSEYRDQETNP